MTESSADKGKQNRPKQKLLEIFRKKELFGFVQLLGRILFEIYPKKQAPAKRWHYLHNLNQNYGIESVNLKVP